MTDPKSTQEIRQITDEAIRAAGGSGFQISRNTERIILGVVSALGLGGSGVLGVNLNDASSLLLQAEERCEEQKDSLSIRNSDECTAAIEREREATSRCEAREAQCEERLHECRAP